MSHLAKTPKSIMLVKLRNKLKIKANFKWSDSGIYLYIKKLNYCIIFHEDNYSIWIEELEVFNSNDPIKIANYINEQIESKNNDYSNRSK